MLHYEFENCFDLFAVIVFCLVVKSLSNWQFAIRRGQYEGKMHIPLTKLCLVLQAVLIVQANIYFPELYEDDLYKPANLGPFPMSYETTTKANTTIIQWSISGEHLIGTAAFSEESGPNNCVVTKLDFNDLKDECKAVHNAVLVDDFKYIISLQCKSRNRVLLVHLFDGCSNSVGDTKWEVVFTSFDSKRELRLNRIGNRSATVVVWLRNSPFYSIIHASNWPHSKISLESNLVIGDLQSDVKVTDVQASFSTLYMFSESCLYFCPLSSCREIEAVPDSCVLTPNNETISGQMYTVRDGERLIVLDKFVPTSQEAHSFRGYFSIYCLGRVSLRMYKCGGFQVQDIVMTFNMITRNPAVYFPCSISVEGTLIACLILGEPRIFDISDRKSAYPISAFTVSAWRLGVAINRFGFASSDIFFFEIVPTSTADPRGFIFNVRSELQPALIASRLLYPSLATSITPAESFLLVNHQNKDIWLFSHGGRIFHRDGSKESSLSSDFEYADTYSFFIADSFSSAGINHNFEHPFAFFSPNREFFAYLSYYRSPYGAFSASAITVTKSSSPDLHSIVSISDKVFVIQAGIDPKNELLLVVQELSTNYLTLQVFKISGMARLSYNMSGILAQAEIKGSWSWDDFDATESTRIWVIYFTSDNTFFVASHNDVNISTTLIHYRIKDDYSLEEKEKIVINNCMVVTNYNDYLGRQIFMLCAETPLKNIINQTYHVHVLSVETHKTACLLSIDHKFGSLLSKYDDLFVTNIPLFDYNEIAQRLVLSFEKTVLMYATDSCPFRLLYRFDHTDLIAGIGTIHMGQSQKPFGITFVTYLQKVDLIGDCINGYGVDAVLPRNYFCSRCTPGHVGLGCSPCPAGFYCSDYSMLQPSGACPEGFYCLEGTSTSNPMADVLDKTATPPHLCPAGAYCPAGTAHSETNDEAANAPQSCISGFYCPLGSVRPTQERCSDNATSRPGGKVIKDCFCKQHFYGDAMTKCTPCLQQGVCIGGGGNSTNNSAMVVPPGYWPDTPGNVRILVKCFTSISRFTPCKGSVCRLMCENKTIPGEERKCFGQCSDPCVGGHTGRLCSQCQDGYYRKSPFHCAPCVMGLKQTICVVIALLASILVLAFYFVRKHKASANQDIIHTIADGQVLEILITFLLVLLGISSTATVVFMVFIVMIVYLQQLRSPPYATMIFIFYIQTTQALLQGHFVWPSFLSYLLSLFEIMYAPVPGLACLPNVFTGKQLGWEGAFVLIFTFPLFLGGLILFYIIVTGTVQKKPVWKKAFLSYWLLLSVLQFPLGNMSLGTLSCKQDPVTKLHYMSSQPWKQCVFTSFIQVFGICGLVVYFLGIPFTLHYWYWREVFPDPMNAELGELLLPGGVPTHSLPNVAFIIFLTVRWMLLSVILSFIPIDWGLQRPLIITLIAVNILLVVEVNPYEPYFPREPENLDVIEKKWFDRLCSTMTGNFLDLLSLVAILISYTALDNRDNYHILQMKSFVIGLLNLVICIYFIIFVLLEDRLSVFPTVSRVLGSVEKLLTCQVCQEANTEKLDSKQTLPKSVLSEAGVKQDVSLNLNQ